MEINLTKVVMGFYTRNDRTLLKDIKENFSKWKHFLCSHIGRLNTANISTNPM